MSEERRDRRPRGIRLGDLDRGQVYRIGYVSERWRWEVLGPEVPGSAEREAERTGGAGDGACAEPAPSSAGRATHVPEPLP
jgi:hypothetical protein